MAKTAKIEMGFRQIHLDFHTGPWIPDVGSKFNARQFAEMARKANVDSITVFAKCHHGHLYYNTRHPARHPSLPRNMDLLAGQVEALHKVGIRAPIYISVQCDEFAANAHPEWLARNPDGTTVGPNPLQPGWQILDMSSPYLEYLQEQTAEVLAKFKPVDGIFFDMCWNQPSVSPWAKAGMARAGLNPDVPADRDAYARDVAAMYMDKLYTQVRKSCPTASCYFNSRPLPRLRDDIPYLTHIEVEALPTGGWGYMYFPMNVRYVRTFGLPYLGMTARFHKSWADFGGLKPEAALKYEICQMMAHGARLSIGDQMHPRGTFDRPAWEMIGRVYGYAKDCQPWCEEARGVADIGVFQTTGGGGYHCPSGGAYEGVVRMLMHMKHQFDVVDAASDLRPYKLLIMPDSVDVDAALARKLDAYVAGGGAVLASGRSGLNADNVPAWKKLPVTGKLTESPYATAFFRATSELGGTLPDMDHVLYMKGLRAKAAAGAEVLARIVEPYFDRNWRHFSSHFQTPPARLTNYPMAIEKGRVTYIAYPIFSTFASHGSLPCRDLVAQCITRLMGRPVVEIDAPAACEVTVMKKGKATVLHVLYFNVEKRTAGLELVENVVPLRDVKVSVALAKKPARAYLAPSRQDIAFAWSNGRAELTIPEVSGHQMVVFE